MSSAAEDLTGATLKARYRLIELLGAGGMGQVYEGVDETLDRKVAVKVLLRKLADDTRSRQRFLREAKAASKIQHPNVVQILDFGETPSGSVFYAMEHLEGRDLAAVLRHEGPLPWSRARHILLQIVKALGATHDRNIIHRDIKPANFFVLEARGHDDFIKLLDFGIAKFAADTAQDERSLALSLTGAGEVMGTAKYMAPEQAYGSSDDPRVDVYAVGVVAYEMLAGTVPFTGNSVFEILKKHVDEPPRPPRELNPAIPAAVEAIVLRALAKDQESRFASMDELEAALASVPASAGARVTTLGLPPPSSLVPMPSLVESGPAAPSTAVVDRRASDEAVQALQRGAPVADLIVPGPAMGPAPAPSPVASDVITAPRPPESRAPAAGFGGTTSVVPTTPRPPSPVTYGVLGGPAGAPTTGHGTGARAMEPPTDAGAVGSTSRIARLGDVGTATGPAASTVPGSDTDPTTGLGMTGPFDEARPRSRGPLVGLVLAGVGLVGLSFLGVVMMSSDADEGPPDGSTEIAAAAAPSSSVGAELPGPSSVETPSAEGAEPEAGPQPGSGSTPTPESEARPEPSAASTPEPEPAPRPAASETKAPKKPTSKPRKPLTDEQVAARLAKSLAKSCRDLGAGQTVKVDLIVSSAGKVVTRSAPGAAAELRKCLLGGAGGASFPEGTTRTVSVKVSM